MSTSCFSSGYRIARAYRVVYVGLCTLFLLILGLFPVAAQTVTQNVTLHLSAAADLQPVMPALAAAYEKATGVKLVASFGSSASLAQQLLNGAPEDVFLSADLSHAQQLFDAGVAAGPPLPYARGVLVLWARSDSPAQPLSLETLSKDAVSRIAVANPEHAPYGAAAAAALRNLHLYDKLAPKLVTAENVGQTAQFAASGNAQAAFISLTIANSPAYRLTGSFVRVPAVYPELRQSAVVLKRSGNVEAARAFLRWLTSPGVQAQLPGMGLDPV